MQFWLSNLPETTPLPVLVRTAKLRWRIENDHREMKQALGLAHFEGRTRPGRHHHVTLVSAPCSVPSHAAFATGTSSGYRSSGTDSGYEGTAAPGCSATGSNVGEREPRTTPHGLRNQASGGASPSRPA